MGPDLDLTTLRLLLAVEQTGSLNAAAAVLGISQPAASARIRAFEARWRLAVMQRSARGSALTADGQAVLSWARSVIHVADSMRTSLDALSEGRRGGVVITASLTIAGFILPQWLGELRTRRPDVQPKLHVVNSTRVAEIVRAGAADVGFIETALRPTDLECRVVGWDRLIVVVAPSHPWARRRTTVPVQQLAAEKWVLREPGSGTRSTFELAVGTDLLCALEVSSTMALVGAAVAGVGPAVVSERAVEREIGTRRLVRVTVDQDLSRPLTAVWRRDRRMTEAVSDLLIIAGESAHGAGNYLPPALLQSGCLGVIAET